MSDHLLLKWGTLKGWDFEDPECEAFKLVKKYMKDAPLSSAMDRPEGDRKKLLCEIIDAFDGEIQIEWTGEYLSKDEAKEYVMEYGN